MKKLLIAILLPIGIYSCGDAGLGFDAGAIFTIPSCTSNPDFDACIPDIDIFIPGTLGGIQITIDPDATSFNYNLSDVDGLQSALQELDNVDGEIFFNAFLYSLSGVETSEELTIDYIQLVFNLASGSDTITLVSPEDGFVLSDVENIEVPLVNQDNVNITSKLENELLTNRTLNSTIIFDLGAISAPDSDFTLAFQFEPTFDVAIRVRDILD